MPVSFARDTIELVDPVWVDARGARTPDYRHPDVRPRPVAGCVVQPGSAGFGAVSTETRGDRQAVSVRWTVYAPAGVVIDAHTAVRWQGVLYQVDGEPARQPSPTGVLDHVVIILIDWEG